ncbi:hypothetical protein B0H19DRAFT_1268865 [Mycena capillaripes]|nr:hypothetical protein B0H19DRAFT_1268865 [Mycena capillaripes]
MPALEKQPTDRKHQVTETHLEPLTVDRIIPQPSSPIHSLPTELLADILMLALQASPPWASFKDVLLLCRICGHWRQVALNTPQVWAMQSFPLSVTKEQMSFTVNKMFLERSAPSPISVYIDHLAFDLVPLLASASYRSRDLTIHTGYSALRQFDMAVFARLLADNLENLETLELRMDSEVTIPLAAPRLHNLTIENVSANILSISWTQLTNLSLSYDSPQLCLDILIRCKNLVSARIRTSQCLDSPVYGLQDKGFLTHLESLNIFVRIRSTGEHLGPFLQQLKLPALKSLTLTLCLLLPVNYEWFISWLAPTLTFSLTLSPNLEYLEVYDCLFTENIYDVLQCTPSLTRLVFSESGVEDHSFAALQYSDVNPVQLAPKLEILDLYDVGADFSETSLADMIRSRW